MTSDDDKVGWRKPPKQYQFKKGRSGNPRGRPKGSKNLKTELSEELSERVSVKEGGRIRVVSKRRALLKRMIAQGINGNDRATAKVFDLYLKVNGIAEEASALGLPLNEEELTVMNVLRDRLQRQARQSAPAQTETTTPDRADKENG
jgi:hypothetical protein